MTIEHKDILDPNQHEPKGVEAALAGQAYIADGLGSGSWVNAVALNKVKTVNSISDFPAPVAGVITLEDNCNYVLGDNISTSNRFEAGDGSSLTSFNFFGPSLTYTGTGTMLSGTDKNFNLNNIRLSAPSGTVFNFTDTVGGTVNFNMRLVIIDACQSLGSFSNLRSFIQTSCSVFSVANGLSFSGSSWQIISFTRFTNFTSSASYIGIDLGTAVTASFEATNLFYQSTVAGAKGIKGAASSANIASGGSGVVTSCVFSNNMTPLDTITAEDVRWSFAANEGVQDTRRDCLLSMKNNATNTVITAANTPVKIAGTYTVERASFFTGDTTGRATFNGETDAVVPVFATISSETVSGGDKNITFYLAKNGSVITASGQSNTVKLSVTGNTTLMWQLSLAQNDYLELWVENNDDTVDVLVKDVSFVIN